MIQKHAARRLHYDLRLELDGALKSWAVPQGPSLDPAERRLAVHVEDHPLDYGGFEGAIPEGEYGGGTVMLWDTGHAGSRWATRHAAYAKGQLKFRLHGEQLRGRLDARAHGRPAAREGKDLWLLIKQRDEFADGERPDDVTSELTDRSIVRDREREGDRGVRKRGRADGDEAQAEPAKAKRPLPGRRASCAPQLATPVDGGPAGQEWLHEIKHDGYRCQLRARRRRGRRPAPATATTGPHRFRALAAGGARPAARSALIDGEVVVLDEQGSAASPGSRTALGDGRAGRLPLLRLRPAVPGRRGPARAPLLERKQRLEPLLATPAPEPSCPLQRPLSGGGPELSTARPAGSGPRASSPSGPTPPTAPAAREPG